MLKRRAFLLGLFATAGTCASAGSEPAFALTEYAPGIFVHVPRPALVAKANQGDIANLSLIVGGNACAVIDTGGSIAVAKRFRAAISAITEKPLRYVVNTHTHPDHLFGNLAFAAPGVTFVGHHNLPRALASREEHYLASFRQQLGEELMQGFEFIMPTQLVDSQTTLDLGGRRLVLDAWPPAHTDCDLTVFDETTRTLFTGDLVFREHIPVLDGSLLGWLKVMDALAAKQAALAIPGHGKPDLSWPRSLDAQRTYFQALAGDIREDIRAGRPLADSIPDAAAAQRPAWALFDEYNGRNASQAFKELEWE